MVLELSSAAPSRTCSSPVLPAGLLGGGAAALTLRCVHLGGCPTPRWVPGSVGAGYPVRPLFPDGPTPSQAHGVTRRNNTTGGSQLSSPGVSSRSNHRSSLSTLAWMLPGCRGALTCTALGRPGAGASSLSCVHLPPPPPVPGGSGLCPPAPWAPGPALLELRSRGAAPEGSRCSPLRLEPPPDPRLLPKAPPVRLQPFTMLGPRCAVRSPRGAPPLLVTLGDWRLPCLSLPAERFITREKFGADS